MESLPARKEEDSGPIFFWREFDSEPYGCMSQWYSKSPFVVEDERTGEKVEYKTAEMWMMIQKAKLFGDEDIAQAMIATRDPSEHQRLGRLAKGFERNKWDQYKSHIVEQGNYYKFSQSPELKQILLSTGERELVEASPTDRIWGVGFAKEDAEQNRKHWGENMLGVALMNVRARLRQE